MDAGKDLDAIVAEKIMGWHKGKGGAIAGPGTGYEWPAYWYDGAGTQQAPCVEDRFAGLVPWSPSTDIAAAWLVVERLRAKCDLRVHIAQTGDSYQVAVNKPPPREVLAVEIEVSAALAICRAALAAVAS